MSRRSEDGVARPLRTSFWYSWWLAPVPPHIYAILRITLGTVGVATLIGLSDVSLFWDPDGLVASNDPFGLKRFIRASSLGFAAGGVLYAAALASFAAMAIGYQSRKATAAALLISLVQVSWNYLPLSGADAAMRCMLFCLVWADVGAVWSVDARLAARSDRRADSDPVAAPIGPLNLIRLQIALIYATSGLWKLLSPLWRDGTALHYVLSSNVYQRFPVDVAPWAEPFLSAATYTTLAWEIGFPVMVLWRRTRVVALAIGLAIHVGIWVGLEIGLFSFVMVAGYAAYLDPDFAAGLPDRLRRWFPSKRVSRYAEGPTT